MYLFVIQIYKKEKIKYNENKEKKISTQHRNCLRIVLSTRLTDRISNSRLYEKCGLIPMARARFVDEG